MTGGLMVPVGDLIGSPGKERPFSGSAGVRISLGQVVIDDSMLVTGRALGLLEAVKADFTATAPAHSTCTRCLAEWDADVVASGERYFRRVPDEDGYGVVGDEIDLYQPAKDELALSLPAVPLCREDCLGLCPTCGTDLNVDPCDGHGDVSDSPFAVLKDLFEP
jgi:DUF177 domain-containing protein